MHRRHRFVAAALATGIVAALGGLAVMGSGVQAFPLGDTSTPPPTPVPPKGSPSPYPTVLVTPRPRPSPPPVSARSAVLEDLSSGQVLFAKNPEQRRAVASLTKMMTAVLALRHGGMSKSVTVSERAASEPGADLGLKPGEVITVRNLLFGLLLESANDASIALAEEVSKDTASFVRLMNRRAKRIGLRRTFFASPSGLNDRGRSTALDLATLTRSAYRLPTFSTITSTKAVDIPSPSGKIRHIQNRNALLWLYPGTFGAKTGFTEVAGWCLIATAHRGSRTLVAVVLGSANQDRSFFDAAALLNYGFLEFTHRVVARRGQAVGEALVEGVPVPAAASHGRALLVRKDLAADITYRVVASPDLELPVTAGQEVGRVTILARNHPIGSIPAVAIRAIAAPPVTPTVARAWTSAYEDAVDLLDAVTRATVGTFL